MELCQNADLYQIDLLKGSGDRITEREYWAQRRGQRRLDYANAKDAASGLPIRQTKYETEKAVLRKNIRSVLRKATNLEDFSVRLLQEYGIALTESRGRFSYRTADRTKPITSRKLGDDFSAEPPRFGLRPKPESCPASQKRQKPRQISGTSPRRTDGLSGGSRLFQGPQHQKAAKPETAQSRAGTTYF